MKKVKIISLLTITCIIIILLSTTIYASEIDSKNVTANTIQKGIDNQDCSNIIIKSNSTKTIKNKNHITYNEKTVVPADTSEKKYVKENTENETTDEIRVEDYPSNPNISMPFYMTDNSIAICIEPYAHLPQSESTYKVGSNHTILNLKTGENVTDYIKIFIYKNINEPESIIYRNDSDNTIESSLRWGVWSFILYDYNTENYPDVFKGFMKNVKEETLNYYNKYGPVPDEGILEDNKTHYKINFLDNTNVDHYQNLISIKTWTKDDLKMAWAWKLLNESTIENISIPYKVNVTENIPYVVTEEYTENITERVPYNTIENYTVNITKSVPYITKEEYTENITVTVPVNKTETYLVNVTKEVPYNINHTDIENTTQEKHLYSFNKNQDDVKNIKKEVNSLGSYISFDKGVGNKVNVKKGLIDLTIKNQPVKLKNNTSANKGFSENKNVVKVGNVTIYKNVTVQEERQRNIIVYEEKTEEVTKFRNVTKYENVTTQEVKQRNITKYKSVTKEVVKKRNVTKYKAIVHEEERFKIEHALNHRYMLYIYLLYLEGNISYSDLVAIVGSENLQFNEDGKIELSFDDINNIPKDIIVEASDTSLDVSTSSDDVDISNPDNLEDPVIDAGIVNVEL